MSEKTPIAVVLLSGGLDSATTAAIALQQGFDLAALTMRYGQRHQLELTAAKRIAQALGVKKHIEQSIDLRAFGGSALTDDIEVPKSQTVDAITSGIPVTYVPARNTIFLSFALAFAETIGSNDIFIGVNAVDYSGYPDCRPKFIEAFEQMARLATKAGISGQPISIHAPLISLTKAEIIQKGTSLDVPFDLTHSCYDPSPPGLACGHCDSCLLRLAGFADAGLKDPIAYTQA